MAELCLTKAEVFVPIVSMETVVRAARPHRPCAHEDAPPVANPGETMQNRFIPSRVNRRRVAFCFTLLASWACAAGLHAERPNAPELKRVLVHPHVVDAVATRMGLKFHDRAGVTISTDPHNAGGLLVVAPGPLHPRLAQEARSIAETLLQEQSSAGSESITNHLVHITWRELEDVLRTLTDGAAVTTSRNGERATFQLQSLSSVGGTALAEVDRRNNTVTLTAHQSMHQPWRAVLGALDTSSQFADQEIRIHRLRQAEPAPIQRAIRLLRGLPATSDAMSNNASSSTRPASRRNGAIFRTAAFQNGDSGQADADPMEDVDADTAIEGGVIGDTQIQFIPESGLIIIKGAKRDVQRVMDVIKEIEQQSELTRPEVEVRQLQNADAGAVATLLTQLYEDVLSARQGEVSITALDAPNALLLIGRKEAISAVLDLIQKIDQPIPDSDRLRVYRLQHASALDAETTIRQFFTARPGSEEDVRPGLGVRVRVTADYRTNSLIVSASPRDLQEVTRLIEELDVREVPSTSQIRVFPLMNARAEELVEVLRDSLTGETEDAPGETTPPSSMLSIVALGQSGTPVLDSGLLTGTVITADESANAIVVRAPAGGMPLIAELIRQLDKAPGIDSLVKVFTIENGDAAQLTTALQNLFGEEAATAGTSVGAGNLQGLTPLTAAESALVPLRFSTDVRTNSIIVSGSAADLEVVESILLRLDSQGFAERITEVIWLKNQTAENIATAIQTYVQQRQQTQNLIPQFTQGLGPFDLPDRDIVVVAEPQTNSLLISVSPRLYEEVRGLIDRLDRRPPMVLIKTLIAEVRLDDGFEIGGEIGLQDSILFDRGIAVDPTTVAPAPGNQADSNTIAPSTPGFNFNGVGLPNQNSVGRDALASRGLTSFGVAASQLGAGNAQGFVFSAASESVNLLLRTLRTANRLQVLGRPEVMTADNTTGFVNVGQLFPRPTEIVINQFGGTQVGIEDIPVGIILQVTPRVGSDGLILMDIDATRSSVDETQGQPIGSFTTGPDAPATPIIVPAINQTTAQSTITAFDGQTVVFGGLITKRRENVSRRVPYLADIPLLGTFFKYDLETESRTELLIVMTPTLVTGDEDLEYVKQVESSRMSWCLADVVEMHGDEGLSGGYGLWGPAIGPTIYPDLHPTVDVFPAADMPGGPRAVHPTVLPEVIPPAPGEAPLPDPAAMEHGIELGPGESLLSPPTTMPVPHSELPEGLLSEPADVDALPSPDHGASEPTGVPGGAVKRVSHMDAARTPASTAAPLTSRPNEASTDEKPPHRPWYKFWSR